MFNYIYFLGSCFFKKLNAHGGITVDSDLVNDVSFKTFMESIITTKGKVTLPQTVSFNNLFVKNDLEARSLAGINSNLFLTDMLLKSKDESVRNILFEQPIKCKDLEALKLNGDRFPDDFVLRKDSWVDFGTKFVKKINIRELTVNGLVDHVNTSDIVTKSTRQEILGVKRFTKGIKVKGNLDVYSNIIDGVDMSALNSTHNDKKVVVFEEGVTVPRLEIKGKVNNMTLIHIAQDLVYQNGHLQKISGKKIFNNLKVNEKVLTKSVSGRKINTFIDTKQKTNISAKKTFSKELNIDTLNVGGLIDNTNVTSLFKESLYLSKPFQVVTGEKHFDKLITTTLRVGEKLNDRSFKNLLTKNTNQDIPRVMYLHEASFNHLYANKTNLDKNGTINAINLEDLWKSLQKDILSENLIVNGKVLVKNWLKLNNINGYDVKYLQSLLQDEPQQILTNEFMFNTLEIKGSASTNSFTSGNFTLFKKMTTSTFHLTRNNFGKEDVYWESIKANEIDVMRLVNRIDLVDLHKDSIYLNNLTSFFLKGESPVLVPK